MTYRVFSGPRGSEAVSPIDKGALLYKELNSLDEALRWASHLGRTERVALRIEGDDGTVLGKREIATTLRHRENEFGSA